MKRPIVTTCSFSSFQTLNPQGESSERQISFDQTCDRAPMGARCADRQQRPRECDEHRTDAVDLPLE
jgi:hypothetical protein